MPVPEVNTILPPLLLILALVTGCSQGEPPTDTASPPPSVVGSEPTPPAQAGVLAAPGCRGCHPLSLDANHLFPCEECHWGDGAAGAKAEAHAGLLPEPAHPERMGQICGKCHGALVEQAAATLHFTGSNEVNLVRQAFGAKETLASLTAIPVQETPTTPLQLADDLLRRRCLRCHLYSQGEAYPATRHGSGCGGCHLEFTDGNLADHRFLARPTDRQCLSCHYGNRVGADYHGRFEHDLHADFRTPFAATAEEGAEPYGVAYHQLTPDLHQRAGLACIDCHGGRELMAGKGRVTCLGCHSRTLGQGAPPAVSEQDGQRVLTLASSGKRLPVPVLRDPAHDRYGGRVSCQVCHAQWSFNDRGHHLLRQDDPDFEPWESLTRQGSGEVEARLEGALFGNDEAEATMSDGITGRAAPGIWLQAYELRRWEEVNTCRDREGVLQVCRPLLDLHLSYTDTEGEVVFDSVTPKAGSQVLLPYTPHTTGRAGAFYQQRLSGLERE